VNAGNGYYERCGCRIGRNRYYYERDMKSTFTTGISGPFAAAIIGSMIGIKYKGLLFW
jgi:hypothetical protein